MKDWEHHKRRYEVCLGCLKEEVRKMEGARDKYDIEDIGILREAAESCERSIDWSWVFRDLSWWNPVLQVQCEYMSKAVCRGCTFMLEHVALSRTEVKRSNL